MKVTLADIEARSIKIPWSGCWIWMDALSRSEGYARRGHGIAVHQEVYKLVYGDIPPGKIVCHKCDIPYCVNPEHLFLGTHLLNARDKIAKGRAAEREKHGRALLDSQAAAQIREMLAAGRRIACVAAIFSVDRRTISHIRNNETWRVS